MSTKKTARIALTAVAVFAIVGAGLALKANSKMRGAVIYCSTTVTDAASSTLLNYTITPLPIGTTAFCTTSFNGTVPTLTYIVAQN